MKKIIALAMTLCMLLALCACGQKTETEKTAEVTPTETSTPSESTTTGKNPSEYKGTVMVYSSMNESVLMALKERFEEIYPNVTFDYYQAGSGKITTKFTTEIQAGSIECDIVWLADASEFVEYKTQGALMSYESEYAATVPDMFHDADNMYIGARAVLTGLCYYSVDVDEATLGGWEMLADEAYKDQIIMTDANNSGSMKTWLYAIVNSPNYGWEFIDKIMANGLARESGTAATHNQVASGAYQIGIGVDFVTKNLIAEGSDIGWHDVTTDAIAYYSPIAIPANCPHEELAKLAYDFIMNPDEGQMILANCNVTPVQPATPIPDGMYSVDWIVSHAIAVDVADMAATSEEMLARYTGYFN